MEKIGIVCDHGALALKEFLHKKLEEKFTVIDYGVNDETSVDYPDMVAPACKKVLSGEIPRLVALCGTGIGASIAANRHKGIRAALCHDEFTAELSKRHNNANVIVLGGRVLGTDLAWRITEKWLTTPFDGGRHQNRIDKLDKLVE